MIKKIFLLTCTVLSIFFYVGNSNAFAQEEVRSVETGYPQYVYSSSTVYFFHSITCPHCRAEQAFLDKIQKRYPDLIIERYEVSDTDSIDRMKYLADMYGVREVLGAVPLTFIGGEYFLGFKDEKTTGKDIEEAILRVLENTGTVKKGKYFDLPFFGRVYQDDFSLPILAILLGFLDGFNVCSLGALMLIIGLTLKLQKRKSIILLGGTFILTTALVYGGLIVLWYKVFEQLSTYINFIKILITLLALGGGVYFFKEYLRMRKVGAQCELQESKLINKLMEKTGQAFRDNTRIVGLLGIVFLFAAVIAIVEFPCSAATPLIFAGVLADAGLSTLSYISYISLFILFYLLDEILIFAVAAYRLKLWMTSGTFTKYAVLAEACILFVIGLIYLNAVLGFF